MMPITSEDYRSVFWATLRDAIDTMLNNPPGSYKAISYEQMYSAVYKCVCNQHSEQLYSDLLEHITLKLRDWSAYIHTVPETNFIQEFHRVIEQYFHALAGIVPIFTYMNRFYIDVKLHTDLKTELLKRFAEIVSDPHITRLLGLLQAAQLSPFAVPPNVMQSLLQKLFTVNEQYATVAPDLFSKHLTGIRPPMAEDDLAAQQEADRMLQERLRQEGFNSNDQSRKRMCDVDPLGSAT